MGIAFVWLINTNLMSVFPVHHICSLGEEEKNVAQFHLNPELNYKWPLNPEASTAPHVWNAIMEFDFLYVVSNATVLIDTDKYL